MKVSRRQLASVLAAPLAAQAPPKLSAGEELQAARKRVQEASEILRKRDVSTSVEPAFVFRP